MTAQYDFERVGFMVRAGVSRRIDSAVLRDRDDNDRGAWLRAALEEALRKSEGTPT